MKVAVSQDKCIAAGQCTLHAEAVFEQNEDDGLVVLLEQHPAAEHAEAVRTAARFCPAQAIQIDE
ncbi:ferredoxin [Nocardia sp. NPDC051030]|uniref:ferredoxin n=1 Tax=Nocardia sp. NPDC051030 TaxID=3155162 RepID=UPI00343E9DA9